MPAPAAAPRWPVDLTGNPTEIVGSTEAARVIGHPRPNRLPLGLLEIADQIERHDDGTVRRRGWKRETLWRYAATVMASQSTTIDGKLVLDRAGVADRLGTHLSRVDAFIAAAPDNGFPEPVEGRWFSADSYNASISADNNTPYLTGTFNFSSPAMAFTKFRCGVPADGLSSRFTCG